MDKVKILLIGASSLLGKTFCDLFSNNYEIHSLGKTIVPSVSNHIECDLMNEIPFANLPEYIDVIIYLAQANNYKDFQKFSKEIFTINTIRVLELMEHYKNRNLKNFIYTSTGGVYNSSTEVHKENDTIYPERLNDFYFKSKFSAELLLNSYSSFCSITILRPFFMFGKNQKESMLIPRLIKSIKNKEVIKLNGEEGIKINPIYVVDAANILNLIINKNKTGIFNIAGNQIVSLKKLCQTIGNYLNEKPIFEYLQDKGKDVVGDETKVSYENFESLKISIKKSIY